jgi:hypothetical protein
VLVCGLLALVPGVARAATPPAGFFGVGDWAWPSTATLDREAKHGLRTWRVPLNFGDVGGVRGRLNFSGADRLMANLASRRIEPLVVLAGCPAWACPAGGPPKAEPALSAWLQFTAAAVRRYGTHGTFWTSRPKLPPQPVRAWQVYNEVNDTLEWPNPSPPEYAAFLGATAKAIRTADPAAKVVASGLAEKLTIWLKDYLAALYQQPGFTASFDILAVHGYAAGPLDAARIMQATHDIMVANGDGARPVWMTEMSWATGGPPHPFVVAEDAQAANLRASWDTLLACAPYWNLQRVYWFGWQDKSALPAADYWGYHNGLLRLDGTPKPALAAIDEYTSAAPLLPQGRGDVCPPDILAPPPPPAPPPAVQPPPRTRKPHLKPRRHHRTSAKKKHHARKTACRRSGKKPRSCKARSRRR